MARQLNETQKAFCREYVGNGGNAMKAYLTVYSTDKPQHASNLAQRLLGDVRVQEYITELNKPLEAQMRVDIVNERQRKKDKLWEIIDDIETSNGDKIRAIDVLNRMDKEYVEVTKDITNESLLDKVDTTILQKLIG